MVSNHGKHKDDNKYIPVIRRKSGNSFPASFPAKFSKIIVTGSKEIDVEYLITDVSTFWKNEIEKYSI